MAQTGGGRSTFVVKILSTQNETWQGTIDWMDGQRTQSFRSALELIKLIDSALPQEKKAGDEP